MFISGASKQISSLPRLELREAFLRSKYDIKPIFFWNFDDKMGVIINLRVIMKTMELFKNQGFPVNRF